MKRLLYHTQNQCLVPIGEVKDLVLIWIIWAANQLEGGNQQTVTQEKNSSPALRCRLKNLAKNANAFSYHCLVLPCFLKTIP